MTFCIIGSSSRQPGWQALFLLVNKTSKLMIKLLSHQKVRLNLILRASLVKIDLTCFFISVGFAHGVTANELPDRRVALESVDPSAAEEKTVAVPQAFLVTGKITDETGMPVPGVNILEKGTTNGTTSDSEGAYKIAVTDANAI